MTTVLTFVSFYIPGQKAGGPIRSVANIVAHVGESTKFRIITTDRDSGDSEAYPGIQPGRWHKNGNAEVCYLSRSKQRLSTIARLMRETPHDIVYLNSFFHPRFTTLPLLAQRLGLAPRQPVILAPRGELSMGALSLRARKKRMFTAVCRLLKVHQDVLWHASSDREADDIRQLFGSEAQIHVASNLPGAVPEVHSYTHRGPSEPLRAVFLSRVSPMKNLLFVLEVLKRVSVPIDLSILGFIDAPEYWEACKVSISDLPAHIRVHYDGIAPVNEVSSIFAQKDLLFLPTLGENFGHVIIEALGAGAPVLISDRTPWQDLERAGCGWSLPIDRVEPYVEVIERLFHEEADAALTRRLAAVKYARRFAESADILEANLALFKPGSRRLR